MANCLQIAIPEITPAYLPLSMSVLREHGAQEIYLFGSIVERFADMEPDDIDIAVSGLPTESYQATLSTASRRCELQVAEPHPDPAGSSVSRTLF